MSDHTIVIIFSSRSFLYSSEEDKELSLKPVAFEKPVEYLHGWVPRAVGNTGAQLGKRKDLKLFSLGVNSF